MTNSLKEKRQEYLLSQYQETLSAIVDLLNDILTNSIDEIQDDIIMNGESMYSLEHPIALHDHLEYVAFTNEPEYLKIIRMFEDNDIHITTNIDDFKNERITYEKYQDMYGQPTIYTTAPDFKYISFTYLTLNNKRHSDSLRFKYNNHYSHELKKYSTYDFKQDPGIFNFISRTMSNFVNTFNK